MLPNNVDKLLCKNLREVAEIFVREREREQPLTTRIIQIVNPGIVKTYILVNQ